ncbi:MAG TPA: macro domain-containing protein, partial [Cellulomonas sp.]
SCFVRSLDVAVEVGARTVAVPAVSAGVYGWEPRRVAEIAVAAVREWVAARPSALDEITFVLLSPEVHVQFLAELGE